HLQARCVPRVPLILREHVAFPDLNFAAATHDPENTIELEFGDLQRPVRLDVMLAASPLDPMGTKRGRADRHQFGGDDVPLPFSRLIQRRSVSKNLFDRAVDDDSLFQPHEPTPARAGSRARTRSALLGRSPFASRVSVRMLPRAGTMASSSPTVRSRSPTRRSGRLVSTR